jgi:DNA replication protein DnaC
MTRPASELAHLFRALKAPAAARALPQLADRARADEWSFEQFAAALLKTEVDSRDSHGGQGRIKAARFPARKTLEEFDFAFQTSIRRDTVLHLGQLDFLAGRENIVLLGPPGTGKSHLAIAIAIRACLTGTASHSAPRPNGSRSWPTPRAQGRLGYSGFAADRRRGRLHTV